MRIVSCALLLILCLTLPAQAAPPATQPGEQAQDRAKKLKEAIESFSLELDFFGNEDRPAPRCRLQVADITEKTRFHTVQIDKAQAEAIIGQLLAGGWLDEAYDLKLVRLRAPVGPTYLMTVRAGDLSLQQNIGIGDPARQRLTGLRGVLKGKAVEAIDSILNRMPAETK